MEKFSRFRDSGTGIQVFLTPVAPSSVTSSSSPLAILARLPAYIVAVVRVALLCIIGLVWALLALLLGAAARPTLYSIFGQALLVIAGFSPISAEKVSLKSRGRAAATSSLVQQKPWQPKGGDVILCNFSSWIDIVIFAIKFNPQFTLPVVSEPPATASSSSTSTPNSKTARRRNAGASVVTEVNASNANANASNAASNDQRKVLGFVPVDFFTAIKHAAGKAPLYPTHPLAQKMSPLDIASLASSGQSSTTRPILIFPELVTSNNRGLLSALSPPIFPPSWRDLYRATGSLRMGKGQANFFVASIKYDPPTAWARTSATSSAPLAGGVLRHIWNLCSDLTFARKVQLRLLDADESPTSANHQADTSVTTAAKGPDVDVLADAVMTLISSMSRLRKTGLGWKDKEAFLAAVNK